MNGSQWLALCCLGILWAAMPGVVVARNFAAGVRQGRGTRGVRTATFVRGVNDTDAYRAAPTVASRTAVKPRIQYSQYARKGQFPYIGALFNSNGRNFCTATLIRPQVLLTAAHCVWDRNTRTFDPPAYVRVGITDASPGASEEDAGELRTWAQIELPEEFRSTPEDHERWDIALIVLDNPVTSVKPVQLATEDQKIGAWRALAVTGFGYYDPSKPNEVSAQLRVGTVAYLTPSVCAKYSTLGAPPENNICAGLVPTATDACPGDSGGPLVIWVPEANKHVQVGIVTWGPTCFNDNSSYYPIGYYSSVGAWSPWINEQLSNYGFL